jgi:hypothetical protein
MLGQLPWAGAPCAGAPELPDGAVVEELPLSVVVDDPELELEPSLVCAWATIAPPPTIAAASPSDNSPLRIQCLFMCITSSPVSSSSGGAHENRGALRDL